MHTKHILHLDGGNQGDTLMYVVDAIHVSFIPSLLRNMGAPLLKEQQRDSKVNRSRTSRTAAPDAWFFNKHEIGTAFVAVRHRFSKGLKNTQGEPSISCVRQVSVAPARGVQQLASHQQPRHIGWWNTSTQKILGAQEPQNLT